MILICIVDVVSEISCNFVVLVTRKVSARGFQARLDIGGVLVILREDVANQHVWGRDNESWHECRGWSSLRRQIEEK